MKNGAEYKESIVEQVCSFAIVVLLIINGFTLAALSVRATVSAAALPEVLERFGRFLLKDVNSQFVGDVVTFSAACSSVLIPLIAGLVYQISERYKSQRIINDFLGGFFLRFLVVSLLCCIFGGLFLHSRPETREFAAIWSWLGGILLGASLLNCGAILVITLSLHKYFDPGSLINNRIGNGPWVPNDVDVDLPFVIDVLQAECERGNADLIKAMLPRIRELVLECAERKGCDETKTLIIEQIHRLYVASVNSESDVVRTEIRRFLTGLSEPNILPTAWLLEMVSELNDQLIADVKHGRSLGDTVLDNWFLNAYAHERTSLADFELYRRLFFQLLKQLVEANELQGLKHFVDAFVMRTWYRGPMPMFRLRDHLMESRLNSTRSANERKLLADWLKDTVYEFEPMNRSSIERNHRVLEALVEETEQDDTKQIISDALSDLDSYLKMRAVVDTLYSLGAFSCLRGNSAAIEVLLSYVNPDDRDWDTLTPIEQPQSSKEIISYYLANYAMSGLGDGWFEKHGWRRWFADYSIILLLKFCAFLPNRGEYSDVLGRLDFPLISPDMATSAYNGVRLLLDRCERFDVDLDHRLGLDISRLPRLRSQLIRLLSQFPEVMRQNIQRLPILQSRLNEFKSNFERHLRNPSISLLTPVPAGYSGLEQIEVRLNFNLLRSQLVPGASDRLYQGELAGKELSEQLKQLFDNVVIGQAWQVSFTEFLRIAAIDGGIFAIAISPNGAFRMQQAGFPIPDLSTDVIVYDHGFSSLRIKLTTSLPEGVDLFACRGLNFGVISPLRDSSAEAGILLCQGMLACNLTDSTEEPDENLISLRGGWYSSVVAGKIGANMAVPAYRLYVSA